MSRMKDGVPSGSLADSEPAACSAGGRRPRGILARRTNTGGCDDLLRGCFVGRLVICASLVRVYLPLGLDMGRGLETTGREQKERCECSFPIQTHHSLDFSLACLHFVFQGFQSRALLAHLWSVLQHGLVENQSCYEHASHRPVSHLPISFNSPPSGRST